MQEPIESLIIRTQQNLEIVGGVNPIQIEVEDDGVVNMLKNHINIMYKLTPLGILFLPSIKNNTEQVFIACRELNDVKKALINSKIYGLLEIFDL